MAELYLTPEEEAMPYWNDLDDAALGKAIKYYGVEHLQPRQSGDDNSDGAMDIVLKAATVGLVCRLAASNVSEAIFTLEGVTLKGQPLGAWKIIFERTEANQEYLSPKDIGHTLILGPATSEHDLKVGSLTVTVFDKSRQ